MRRAALAALISVGVVGASFGQAQATPPGPCVGWFTNMKPRMGAVRVEHRVHALTRCAVRTQGFPGGYDMATCIQSRESSFWPWADSGSSLGLFQLHHSYYEGWVRAWIPRPWFPRHYPPSAFVARSNVLTAMELAGHEGLSPWGGGCA